MEGESSTATTRAGGRHTHLSAAYAQGTLDSSLVAPNMAVSRPNSPVEMPSCASAARHTMIPFGTTQRERSEVFYGCWCWHA
jgi:hypothetical protein